MNRPVARCLAVGVASLFVAGASLAGTVAQAAIPAAAGPVRYPVKAKVPVGRGEPWSVAADARSGRVYVANLFDQSVTVISTATDKVIATTRVGEYPRSVAVDPDTGRVYVAGQTSIYDEALVQVIDPATGTVTATISFPDNGISSEMSGIAVNPRTDTVYANLWSANRTDIAVINGHTGRLIKKIKVPRGGFLDDIAVNSWTNQVYVTSRGPHAIIVINGATNDYQRSFPACPGPDGIAVNERDRTMYVTCYYNDDLAAVDTATGKQLAAIPTGTMPYDDAYSGNAIYEINSGPEDLWVISTPR
jgi:YVTN family beta-propeller protein